MRLLIFGPNGSGKGTQSALLKEKTKVAHIESGAIFRDHAKRGTELGREAKSFTDQGKLVPDRITIPMILDRLNKDDCKKGWILDGFPRNPSQAKALVDGLKKNGTKLDAVIEIVLDRFVAKARLMGRRSCPEGHPNNMAIEAIKPEGSGDQITCWKCGAPLTGRSDDMDEEAIDVRLDIYFDGKDGTLASVRFMERWAKESGVKFLKLQGAESIELVQKHLLEGLNIQE